jgi:hypothetical protein
VYFIRLLHARRVCRLAPQGVTSAAISGVGDIACQVRGCPGDESSALAHLPGVVFFPFLLGTPAWRRVLSFFPFLLLFSFPESTESTCALPRRS